MYIAIIVSLIVIIILSIAILFKGDFDEKLVLAWLVPINLLRVLTIAGVYFAFKNLFQKTSTVSSNLTVYIILVIVLILLFQATNKISISASIKEIVTTIRNYLAFIIIASGFLYWHISNIQPQISPFEAWIIGLDVILAHVVITIPILQWLYYMILKIIQASESLLLKLTDHLENSRIRNFTFNFFHEAIPSSLSASASLGLVWLLLIKTVDLQKTLFGEYNQLLGWEVSTSYRFSILFEQLKVFFDNQVLATIFGFAAFSISLTLSFSSLLNSIKNIKSEIHKEKDNS